MKKLSLLFAKDSLYWCTSEGSKTSKEQSISPSEKATEEISKKLDELLSMSGIEKIEVTSAINKFGLTPFGFEQHDLAYDLISYNSSVEKEKEEVMLTTNKKFFVQFYYSFPKEFYQKIERTKISVLFGFSGERFLQKLIKKAKPWQVHINLYKTQVEFFILQEGNIILYNNLDSSSEVDFLYFIMFSISKIGVPLQDAGFFIYGEYHENETFLSELAKFGGKPKLIRKYNQQLL